VTESAAPPDQQLGADYFQHPLAYFARMREEGPVTPVALPGGERSWLVAGHETTTNLIASGTLALLANPAELERLRAEPALLPGATEELLRYVNPLNHATERFTLEAVEIGGVRIPAREWVLCVTSSARWRHSSLIRGLESLPVQLR
jgi:cytochrome P450